MRKASVLLLVLMLWATGNTDASAQEWVWAPDFEVGDPKAAINRMRPDFSLVLEATSGL